MERNREFKLGEWQVTPLRGVLHNTAETRRLTPKSMDVLIALASRHGEVVERDTLLGEVWEGRAFSDEPLNKCIAELRRQLGDSRNEPRYIETIPKRGYRLIAEFAWIGDELTDDEPEQATGPNIRAWVVQGALMLAFATILYFAIGGEEQPTPVSDGTLALAVLPFDLFSQDDSQEYFADGMHEELIAVLSQNDALSVRSRTSTLQYRGTESSLPDIGAELNVDVIVEGSVRYDQGRVRVTAQLVDAVTDSHLWAGNYEESLTVADLFSIQNSIATSISGALETTLAPAEAADELPTENLQAYDHFMLGKYHYRRLLPGDLRSSVENFEAAVALDPQFAEAWDWLAYAYNHAATAAGYLSPHDAYPKARVAALRALEIDPQLATAVAIIGYIRAVYEWDWTGAERDMRRALELNPNDSGTVWSLAHVLSLLGRHGEAIELTKDFAEREPGIGRRRQEVANRLIDAGRYDEALQWLTEAEERGAEQGLIADTRGYAYFADNNLNAALEQYEFAADARQRAIGTLSRLSFVYARQGRRTDAQAIADELRERNDSGTIPALTLATLEMGLGNGDVALDYLEQSAEDRDRAVIGIANDAFFRDLREEPRFQALIEAFNFPD